jgi:YaiO family outer membrane protein
MKTARYAALIAGAVCLHSIGVIAGEGSSLRGLKPPRSALVHEGMAYGWSGGEAELKRSRDDTLADFALRSYLSGGATESRRFATTEGNVGFALHQPVGQNVPALAESNIHTMQDLVPRYTLYSQVTRNLPGGWGLGFGVRQTEYNFTASNLFSFSAERQWGNVRGAYTLFSNRGEGAGLAAAHRLEVTYLYGERNTIGLAYTTGRDIDNIPVPAGLQLSDARDWTLSGRHWLSPNWALTYDVLTQDLGPLTRRQGLRLGVSRSF